MCTVITDEQAKINISRQVQTLLAEREWTQADLARAVEESPMRISVMVRGEKLPSAAFLARIAEALGVSADFLLSPPRKIAQSA